MAKSGSFWAQGRNGGSAHHIMFRGLQTGRVDEKYRLKFPAQVRAALKAKYNSVDLFITSLDKEEVKIFPLSEWEVVERRLSENDGDGEGEAGERKSKILVLANHYGAEQSLDAQGRILVPGALRDALGMRSDVSLLWHANHILALSADRYNQKIVDAELTPTDKRFARNLGI